jgi:hypothetical protein
MSLATRCMIICVSIGMWEGRKLDKGASSKANRDAGAKDGTARVTKRIVSDKAFSEIVTARNAIKAHVETHALPWKDKGDRILMRNMYERFIEQYATLEANFNDAATNFVTNIYPPERESAAFDMGEFFNPDDYPPPDELKRRFYVRLTIEPVPEANDFRVALDQSTIDHIKAQLEESINQRLVVAMKDVYVRIMDVIKHYVDKMSDPKAIFRDSTVQNLVDLVDLLPGLNVTGDVNLRSIRLRLANNLYQIDPDDLRKDEATRAAAAQEAQDILDDMRGFMGAMK